MCSHGGVATPTAVSPAVTVMGMPVVVQSAPFVIAGCPLAAIPSPACVSGTFIVASTTVTSFGQPVIVSQGASTCLLTGTPMLVVTTQVAVSAL